MPDPVAVQGISEIQSLAQNGVSGAVMAGIVLIVKDLINRRQRNGNGRGVTATECGLIHVGVAKDLTHIKETTDEMKSDVHEIRADIRELTKEVARVAALTH